MQKQLGMIFLVVVLFLGRASLADGPKPIRVLSIDGGGIRGLIAAVILQDMEKRLNKPVSKVFDLVAGTSTGGLIAIALTAPLAEDRPRYSASKVVDLYIEQGREIFSASFWHRLKTIGGLLGPKYQSHGLRRVLQDHLGDLRLSETLIPTLITGYHIEGQSGVEFFSEDAKDHPEDKDCLMYQVGMATSAAPIYFESVDIDFAWGKLLSVADGALYKHNPALLAYTNAKTMYPDRKVELYSIGTGQASAEDVSRELKGRGLISWLSPIVKHIVIGGSDADQAVLHRLLNIDGQNNYFRLDVRIGRGHKRMDDTSEWNIDYLLEKGNEAIKSSMYSEMIERLGSR
jgi:patatin-like phospholipase/acyl hydrolase